MKPPPFAYSAPATSAEALALLADLGRDGTVLAGGQSLVPLLNMRLVHPTHLVDINGIAELDVVTVDDGGVRVGAGVRTARLEGHGEALAACELLRHALPLVAHPVIRNRGTTVGSLVHADPSGEMTAVLALTGGSVTVATPGGPSTIGWRDLFVGPLETSVHGPAVVLDAFFPALPYSSGTAFAEIARRKGDYAVCGAAVVVTVDEDLRVVAARAAYLSVGPVPEVHDLTDAVAGRTVQGADWAAAGELARGLVEPDGDLHASADYRRLLVATLTTRTLAEAGAEAARRAMAGS